MTNNNTWNEINENLAKLLVAQKQNKVCSKVCGRENYVIRLYNGKVTFSGTKKQYKDRYMYSSVPLMEAYRYNTFFFTYKKDWLNALQTLKENS